VLSTEAGHQLVPGNDRLCACGQRGCLDTLVGGRALERFLGRPLDLVDDEGFWRQYAETLAPALANVALSAGVDAMALGGSIVPRSYPVASLAMAASGMDSRLTPSRLRSFGQEMTRSPGTRTKR